MDGAERYNMNALPHFHSFAPPSLVTWEQLQKKKIGQAQVRWGLVDSVEFWTGYTDITHRHTANQTRSIESGVPRKDDRNLFTFYALLF